MIFKTEVLNKILLRYCYFGIKYRFSTKNKNWDWILIDNFTELHCDSECKLNNCNGCMTMSMSMSMGMGMGMGTDIGIIGDYFFCVQFTIAAVSLMPIYSNGTGKDFDC